MVSQKKKWKISNKFLLQLLCSIIYKCVFVQSKCIFNTYLQCVDDNDWKSKKKKNKKIFRKRFRFDLGKFTISTVPKFSKIIKFRMISMIVKMKIKEI